MGPQVCQFSQRNVSQGQALASEIDFSDKICPYFHEFAADSYEPRILLRSARQIDRGCFSFS